MENKFKGTTGLINNGNFCYMNSALQCLSNISFLMKYFTNDSYQNDLNTNSVSAISKEFALILKQNWVSNKNITAINPYQLKMNFGSVCEMYNDSSQKDSFEFITFFIDRLHEELNRVKKKEKNVNHNNSILTPVAVWNNFINANQSIFVDLFYGLYQSSLKCLKCESISNTYEPFMSVNLPIVDSNNDIMRKKEIFVCNCFVIFYDLYIKPIQIKVPIYEYKATIGNIRVIISKIFNMKISSFTFVKIEHNGDFDMILDDNIQISSDIESIFCFQNNPLINNEPTIIKDNILELLQSKSGDIVKIYHEPYSSLLSYTIDTNWFQTILFLYNYNIVNYTSIKSSISFPRPFYINKHWTAKDLYDNLILYFEKVITSNGPSTHDIDFMIRNCFFSISTSPLSKINEAFPYSEQAIYGYPFILQFKSIQGNYSGNCIFCGKQNCGGCPIPYSSQITIQMIVDIISENFPFTNNYYHIPKNQRGNFNEFVIDIIWLPYYVSNIKSLNEKDDLNISYDGNITIYDCFNLFVQTERLSNENKWICNQCKSHQNANKNIMIYHSPNVLIIGFNRFKGERKNEDMIQFPIENFDISKYVIDKETNETFDLIGVINHYGSLNSGHYVSICKNFLYNKWFMFNDSQVKEVEEGEIVNRNAYVLFYQRKGLC